MLQVRDRNPSVSKACTVVALWIPYLAGETQLHAQYKKGPGEQLKGVRLLACLVPRYNFYV